MPEFPNHTPDDDSKQKSGMSDVEDFNAAQRSSAVMKMSAKYSGPLPPASQFKIYEDTCPGAATRILDYMDKEQSYRHEMEGRLVRAYIKETAIGQYLGFSVMMFLILAAVVCALNDKEILGAALIASAALGVVTKFIDGKSVQNPDKNE